MKEPTGKTGVAFGLVMSREGSGIRVESERKKNEQIRLNYYIGMNIRRQFQVIIDRSAPYQEWLRFRSADSETETFEFYYTDVPEVMDGNIPVAGNPSIHRRKCIVDHSADGANIYMRITGPSRLEYVVATEEQIASENVSYISSVYEVQL